MSQIDDLISKHCAGGVPRVLLSDLLDRVGKISWADQGSATLFYIDLSSVDRSTQQILNPEIVSAETAPSRAQQLLAEDDVLFGTTRPMLKRSALVDRAFAGQVASTGFAVLRPRKSELLPGFLFHSIGTEAFYSYVEANQRGASYPAISDTAVKNYQIPLPPLEVQQEIVRILDKFTQLEAELEAELEARQKQYEHYRVGLLSEAAISSEDFALGDLGEIVTGKTPKSSDSSLWGGDVLFVTPSDIKDGMRSIDQTARTLSESGCNAAARNMLPAGSVLVTCIGADMGKTIINDKDCVTNQQINSIVLNGTATSGYLFHLLSSMRQQLLTQGQQTGATLPIINKTDFSRIRVKIPPLSVQEEVTNKLDQFDALVNDLSSGLPAEIAARRKQYEYYRDKLLTFEELPV